MKLLINNVNWPSEFPERPEASVDVTNDHEYLYLHYHVRGRQLRAVTTEDQGPVWEDSCVEFFCQVPGDKHYMNFETNCIGAMVASRRLGRAEDVQPFPPEEMALIQRRCTYPREAFEERDGEFAWEVELRIPLRLIFREMSSPSLQGNSGEASVFPRKLRVNFYKCADKTKYPHFLSWQPIPLPQPNFHCPEFFGEIELV